MLLSCERIISNDFLGGLKTGTNNLIDIADFIEQQ